MQIWNFLKKHKVIIGSVWAFITTCLSLYWGIYPIEHNPKLTIYEKNKIDAFSLKKPIEELQIFVNGRNIEKDSLNLRVLRFKLINNGDKDIRSIDYSNNSDFGLRILNGKCIRVNLDSTNDLELSTSLFNKFNSDSSFVEFNKIFIPQKNYVMIDVWLVHKKNINPQILISGKIADTEITITTKEESNRAGRDLLVGLFAIILVFCLVLILMALIYVFNFVLAIFRKNYLQNKLSHYYNHSNVIHRILLKNYVSLGSKSFKHIMNIVADNEVMNKVYYEEILNKEMVEKMIELYSANKVKFSSSISKLEHYYSDFLFIVEEIDESGFLVKQDNGIQIKDDFISEINLFLRLL